MGKAFAVNEAAARVMRGAEKRIMGLKEMKILKSLRAS